MLKFKFKFEYKNAEVQIRINQIFECDTVWMRYGFGCDTVLDAIRFSTVVYPSQLQ